MCVCVCVCVWLCVHVCVYLDSSSCIKQTSDVTFCEQINLYCTPPEREGTGGGGEGREQRGGEERGGERERDRDGPLIQLVETKEC